MSKFSNKFVVAALMAATVVAAAGVSPVANAQTATDLQAQIQALLAQIATLQGQLGQGGSTVTTPSYNFTRNLTVGSKGEDVKALQQWLNAKGYTVAVSGAGSAGSETTTFGPATKAALVKFQKAAGISPASGYFGPLTRAKIAELGAGSGSQGGTVTPTTGGLTVSLASNNPVGANVAAGAGTIVPFLSVNFAAGSSDVTVSGLNVNRTGLSSDSDIQNVYLMDGATVVATNLGLSNGVISFSNAGGLFTVKAGTVKTMTLGTSIATAGRTIAFSIPSASAITANATVGGNFPLQGNTMTGVAVTNLGGIQMTNSSAASLTVNAGQTNFQVGQFTVQAQNQAMQLRSVKFTMTGTASPSDLANIKLYNGGTLLGTVSSLNGNIAAFDFGSNPLQLTSGQTAILYLYADIQSGVNRNFAFSIQRNYDVVAHDMMYNQDVLATLNTGSFPMNLSTVTIDKGNLTVTKSATSPSTYILPGGTNQTIAKFDLRTAGEAIRVTGLRVSVASTTGSITLGNITNLKVVDDAGQQIGATQSTVAANTDYSSVNYVIPANTTRVLSVIVDLANGASGNLRASLSNITAEGFTSLASANQTGPFAGNYVTSNSSILSATQNYGVGAQNVVAGNTNTKVASFALTAGPASAVNVSNIQLTAKTGAAAAFQNLRVMVGSTQIGQTQSNLADGTSYTFTASSPVAITAGGQTIVDVYADVKSGATFSANPVVELAAGGVTAIAAGTNQAVTGVPGTAVAGQNVAIVGAGTLTYSTFNTPAGAQIGMGQTGVKLATYRFVGSANEAMTVSDITLHATTTNPAVMVNYRLVDETGNTKTASLNGTDITFVGANLTVPQNGNLTVYVMADANSWANLQAAGVETSSTNASVLVAMPSVTYQGQSSSQLSTASTSAAGNTFNVLRTTLSAATGSGVSYTTGVSDGAVVGLINFTAGSSDDAYVTQMTVAQTYAGANAVGSNTVFTLVDKDTNQVVGSSSATSTSGLAVAINLNQGPAASTGLAIPKGQTKTVIVKADLTTAGFTRATAGSAISYQLKLNNWQWSDGTRTGLVADTSFTLPVAGSANSLQL